jgi:hypothetical protein
MESLPKRPLNTDQLSKIKMRFKTILHELRFIDSPATSINEEFQENIGKKFIPRQNINSYHAQMSILSTCFVFAQKLYDLQKQTLCEAGVEIQPPFFLYDRFFDDNTIASTKGCEEFGSAREFILNTCGADCDVQKIIMGIDKLIKQVDQVAFKRDFSAPESEEIVQGIVAVDDLFEILAKDGEKGKEKEFPSIKKLNFDNPGSSGRVQE